MRWALDGVRQASRSKKWLPETQLGLRISKCDCTSDVYLFELRHNFTVLGAFKLGSLVSDMSRSIC